MDISLAPEPTPPERPELEPSNQPGHDEPVYKVASEPAPAAKSLYPSYERDATTAPPRRPAPAAPAARLSVPSAPLTPPAPPGEYVHHRWVALNPRVLPPLVMVSVVLLFFLLFFSWAGMYPGGYGVYSQSAVQTSFGWSSKDEVGVKALGDANAFSPETIRANWLMFFYFLLVLVALVLALTPLVVTQGTLKLPPALQQLWPWRTALLGGTLTLAFLIVVLQSWIGFGIERAATAQVDAGLQTQREGAKTPEEQEIVNIQRAMHLGRLGTTRTGWYHLAIFLQILALLGIGLEIWLEKRATRPVPRADVYW